MGLRKSLKKIGSKARSVLSSGAREVRGAGRKIDPTNLSRESVFDLMKVGHVGLVPTMLTDKSTAAGVANAAEQTGIVDAPTPDNTPPPAVMPQMDTEEIARVRRRYAAKMAGSGGRASTILTNAGDTLGGGR